METNLNKYLSQNNFQDVLTKIVLGGVTFYSVMTLVRAGIQTTIPAATMLTPGCTEEIKKIDSHGVWFHSVFPYMITLVLMWGAYNYNSSLGAIVGLLSLCILPSVFIIVFPGPSMSALCAAEAEKLV